MSKTDKKIEVRYIGPYGRGQHRAYASGVGEVFYGQIVKVTEEQFQRLPDREWERTAELCLHIGMGGEGCWNKRGKGLPYCALHQQEFEQRAQSLGKETPVDDSSADS